MKRPVPPANPKTFRARSPLHSSKSLICGRYSLPIGRRTLVMGILNVTPDSFSDGGKYLSSRRAVAHALKLQREGADILDIGGESTRPGSKPVSSREEIRRILPVIESLQSRLSIPISVDTSKASVAKAALKAGASLVNDVTALRDPRMARVIAAFGVPVILMHMRGTPKTMQRSPIYRRLIPEVLQELRGSVRKAVASGISRDKILLDPGIGFSKGPEHNLVLIEKLPAFRALGFPVVVGPSRKSFLRHVLGEGVDGRLFGTAAAVAFAAANGADIVRVHDVAAMKQVVSVVDAIRASSWSAAPRRSGSERLERSTISSGLTAPRRS